MYLLVIFLLPFHSFSKSAICKLQQVCSSQLAASLQITTCSKSAVRNLQQVCSSQIAASLLTTCNRLVVIKPEQAMRTHPDIGLMIAACSKSAADLLQLARFWLCSTEGKIHYVPHQAVVRKDAMTTKLRIVYDASAKPHKSAVALSDCLEAGPSLNPHLFDILLRFREKRIAIVADIEKAFFKYRGAWERS